MRFNYVMDCKEFVWILTNASNTIIEKKIISVFFKTKKNKKLTHCYIQIHFY